MFGRMYVNVDHGRVNSQEQDKSRLAVAMKDIGIGLAHSVRYCPILDVPPVYVQLLPVGAAAGVGGAGNDTLQRNQALFILHVQALIGKILAQPIKSEEGAVGHDIDITSSAWWPPTTP